MIPCTLPTKPKTKKRTKTSPTARTLRLLRGMGYQAFVVERWNPHVKRRQDFGGFADILALSWLLERLPRRHGGKRQERYRGR